MLNHSILILGCQTLPSKNPVDSIDPERELAETYQGTKGAFTHPVYEYHLILGFPCTYFDSDNHCKKMKKKT